MVRGIGAASNNSIALINNKFVFISNLGDIAVYDGGLNVEIVSGKIEGTLSNNVLNLNRLQYASAVAFDDESGDQDYYVSVSTSGSGTHNLVLVYDTFYKAWTKFSGINANAMAEYELGTQQKAVMFGNYSGFANRYPNGDDDAGTQIEAFYQTGHLPFDVPSLKTFREFQLFVRQEGNFSITFEQRVDFADSGPASSVSLAGSGAVWDSAIWDASVYGDVTTAIVRIPIDTTGDFFQWRVEDTSSNPAFRIRGGRLWLEPVPRIGGSPVSE
jgi:hypothetical protein